MVAELLGLSVQLGCVLGHNMLFVLSSRPFKKETIHSITVENTWDIYEKVLMFSHFFDVSTDSPFL